MTSRPVSPSFVALLLCLVLGAGCGADEVPTGPTASVERGQIERVVVATGTIEPAKEVEVRPRIAGIIERIHVEAGDLVEPGQLLIEIERELLESQVREAEAALREAEVELRYAGLDSVRAQELLDSGVSSTQHHENAASRTAKADAQLARAQARLETLQTQLGYARILSPLAGRVLDVETEEGNAVSPVTSVTGGTLLLSLAGTDKLHLEGLVDENEVARIELGQPARIRTEAFGDQIFDGRVARIAPLGERIQNVTYFEVEIEIVDSDAALLRPRMSGDGEIITEVVEDAILVPETALHYRGGEIFVETRNHDGFVETTVEIGIVDGARVEVVNGLEGGEEVRLQ